MMKNFEFCFFVTHFSRYLGICNEFCIVFKFSFIRLTFFTHNRSNNDLTNNYIKCFDKNEHIFFSKRLTFNLWCTSNRKNKENLF